MCAALNEDGSMSIMQARHTPAPSPEDEAPLIKLNTEPTGGYGIATLCGATVGLLISHAVSRFYDQPQDFAVFAGIIGIISGGVTGLLGYKRAKNRFLKSKHKETENTLGCKNDKV